MVVWLWWCKNGDFGSVVAVVLLWFFGFEVVSVVVLWCGCGGVVLVVLLWW